MKKERRLVLTSIIGIMIAILLMTPSVAIAVDGPGTVDIQADSSDTVTGIGDPFTLTVTAHCGAQNIDGSDTYLTFDPALLQVTTAPTLGAGWMAITNTYDNGTGYIEIDTFAFTPVNGDVELYSVGFTVQHDSGTAAMVLVEPAAFPATGGQWTVVWDTGSSDITGDINGAGYRLPTPGDVDPLPIAPVPEIITIALLAIGLLALGGFLWYRKRTRTCPLTT